MHVEFRRKFPKLIKLKELQKYAKDGGILRNMQTLRQSRLSVSKVSKKEWDFIMSLVEDDDEEEPVMPAPQAHMIADMAAEDGTRAERMELYDARSSRSNRAVCNGGIPRLPRTKPNPSAETGNAGTSNLVTGTLGTNADPARLSGTESKRSAQNGNPESSKSAAEKAGSNGNSALPLTAGPGQKIGSGNLEASIPNSETSSATSPVAKMNTANKSDTEPANQTQDAAEHLRELADPLEHLNSNSIANALATMLPGPLAPS